MPGAPHPLSTAGVQESPGGHPLPCAPLSFMPLLAFLGFVFPGFISNIFPPGFCQRQKVDEFHQHPGGPVILQLGPGRLGASASVLGSEPWAHVFYVLTRGDSVLISLVIHRGHLFPCSVACIADVHLVIEIEERAHC